MMRKPPGRSAVGPRQNQVRVALIGYGTGGALFHAPFIAADPRLDLAAVVTADDERRREVLSRYPGTDVLGRTGDLLDRLDEVDLVVVSTPNATHAGLAEAVLSQGKPVVVDKPVTPSAAQRAGWPPLRRSGTRGWCPSRTGAGTATSAPWWTSCSATRWGSCTHSNHASSAGSRRSRPIRDGPGRTTGSLAPAPAYSSTWEATSSTRPSCCSADRKPSTARWRRVAPRAVWTTTSSSPSTTWTARGCTSG